MGFHLNRDLNFMPGIESRHVSIGSLLSVILIIIVIIIIIIFICNQRLNKNTQMLRTRLSPFLCTSG